ncbi:uncharacterized protein Pbp49 [Plodia interpunctella]|uniref:uncharacterized protein Pbp49 n=1 Tax=Plodia interpunctella TaxID=58824 RepID=UPI002367BE0E|nr:uncharacterized protein LOC128675948 [Plodia interpunctella]
MELPINNNYDSKENKSKSPTQIREQSDESNKSQIWIDSTNQNESVDQTTDQSHTQSEMETERNIENNSTHESSDKTSSEINSVVTTSAHGMERVYTFVTNVTGEEIEMEQNEASYEPARINSAPEDINPTNVIPEKPTTDISASHSNQDQSENVTSVSNKMVTILDRTNNVQTASSVDCQVPIAVPSCSNTQFLTSTSHEIVQESTISKNTPEVDTEVPSTSGYNKISSESEPNDLLVEIGSKNAFDAFNIPVVNIYGEDKGPRFYNVSDNLVSKPIIPNMLSEAFSVLPIFGRPKNKSQLPDFLDEKIKEFVGCGLENSEFERLAEYCSPDNLRTGRELVMAHGPGQGIFPSDVERLNKNTGDVTTNHDLNIVRKHRLRMEKDTKNLYAKRFKYRGIRMMSLGNVEDDHTPVVTLGMPVMPGKDLIFVIRWYRPFSYNPMDKNQYRTRHSVFSCNILMLGRHKLSVLRDSLVCPNDVDLRVDVSENPDEIPRSTAKEMFPSGFLFINNVFYVDYRQGCVDYSLPLRRWARARGAGDFQSRDMAVVRLDQLAVRLAHPEVYVHQGNCEHLFTISEIRLVTASDPLRLSSYPCHTALSQNQTVYCTTCAEFGAKWIVVGCPRVPFDPAFFCEKCFKLYLYKDGKKIGDFKAYLYRGNEINVLKPQ